MKPTRILSLDGGGIRGYLTVLLLEQLVEERPTLLDEVHLFAGTSVGSIVALALASGYSPTEVRLFLKEKENISFPQSHCLVDVISAVPAWPNMTIRT